MFNKATKKQAKLRLAVMGPSGSGKTMTSLRLAKGIGGKIAVIDTERGSASKYSDRFEFDVCELLDHGVQSYIKAIKSASGYDVLIIDSLSHAWQELLAEIDKIAKTKYSGNSWSAWSEGTPLQRKLIDSILGFNGHLIATMRTKTEWVIETNSKGKNMPKKVGTAVEQGKGIEYEFDMLMDISIEHFATFSKDRSGRFQDRIIENPGESVGKEMADWLNDGEKIVDNEDFPLDNNNETHAKEISDAIISIKKCPNLGELQALWKFFPVRLQKVDEIFVAKESRKYDLENASKSDPEIAGGKE